MFSPGAFYSSDDECDQDPRILVRDLNDHITCLLCYGYLIDATVLSECYHCFCRSCILQHLRTNSKCPVPGCNKVTLHNTDPFKYLKSDRQLQELINKVVPNLLADEHERRAYFYRSQGLLNPEDLPEDSESEGTTDIQELNFERSSTEFVDYLSLELLPINDETPSVRARLVRISIMATISTLQKLVKTMLDDPNIVVDFYFKNEILGKHHTLKFIVLTRFSRYKGGPLKLYYKIDNHPTIAGSKRVDDVESPVFLQDDSPESDNDMDVF